jgi:predicted permease
VSSTALLLRSLMRVLSVDPGFRPHQVLAIDMRDTEPAARYGETDSAAAMERRAGMYRELDRRLNEIAGVRSASLSWLGLFGGNYVGVNTYDTKRPEDSRFTLTDYVSPRYFETIGMGLLRGRLIEDSDREGRERVALVNEAFVRERVPPGEEAIGRQLVMTYGTDKRPFTIVGVLRDAKYNSLREKKTEPMMWVPLSQAPVKITSVYLRVEAGTETEVLAQARELMRSVSPHLMVRRTRMLQEQVDTRTIRERLLLKVTAGFAGLALVLSAIGLYGSLAYAVTRRTREIGVRLALGASRAGVTGMMLREATVMVIGGLAIGLPLSVGASRLFESLLFGIEANDVWSWLGSALILMMVGVVAAMAPARRASHVDPVVALKYE